MSRQSKAFARQKGGTYGVKGPAKTEPKHGKAVKNRTPHNRNRRGTQK